MLDASQMYGYELYGLRITADQPRPEAQHLDPSHWPKADISIHFHENQPAPASYDRLAWRTLSSVGNETARFRILVAEEDGILHHSLQLHADESALVAFIRPSDQPGHRIAARYDMELFWHNHHVTPDQNRAIVLTWTFDLALGHVVRLCVPANLHGSALAIDGQSIALLGDKGAGKSTLTAALVKAGWRMLADDHVALWPRVSQSATQFWVEPGAPRLRLWPTSLSVIDMQADELPRLYSFQEKRLVALREGKGEGRDSEGREGEAAEFQATALPLAAIYLLEARDPQRTHVAITRLRKTEALYALFHKRFSSVNVSQSHAAAELSILSQIAQQTPVLRLYRPDGLETLPHVIESIRHDLASRVTAPTSAPTLR